MVLIPYFACRVSIEISILIRWGKVGTNGTNLKQGTEVGVRLVGMTVRLDRVTSDKTAMNTDVVPVPLGPRHVCQLATTSYFRFITVRILGRILRLLNCYRYRLMSNKGLLLSVPRMEQSPYFIRATSYKLYLDVLPTPLMFVNTNF